MLQYFDLFMESATNNFKSYCHKRVLLKLLWCFEYTGVFGDCGTTAVLAQGLNDPFSLNNLW
jgi:hypothetical protein